MDLSSLASGILSGLPRPGRNNQADEITESRISGGKPGKCWQAGFASVPVLPDDYDTHKYYLAGYHENTVAEDLLDPQYVSVMYLSDGGRNNGRLFISIDCVGLLNNDVNHIRKELKVFCDNAGICEVNISATHDHAGIDTMGIWGRLPRSGKSSKFMGLIFTACYKCSIEAYKNRKDGKLFFGDISAEGMQEDVRTPVDFSDKLSRFRFVPNDGSDEIWFVNFAAHAESLQGSNHLISADFPGYMREYVKDNTGADVLYTNGAIGGMVTMHIENEEELRKKDRLFESTRDIGYNLGKLCTQIENETELTPCILSARKEFFVSVENPVLTIACNLGILNVTKYTLPYQTSKAIKTEITYLEIGGKKLLTVPGELFPELASGNYLSEEESATGEGEDINPVPLNTIARDENLIILGLTNDEIGYIIPPNDYLVNAESPYLEKAVDRLGRRHYEETNSVGEGCAQALQTAVSQLMADVLTYKTEADLL